jgi:phospholipid/cholesterol/gamma-HCH transport system ATP-binding protein
MTKTASTPKIEMSNVVKSFGDKHVLQGINLTIEKGESLVIIGGSGTGKSVMLKSVLSIIEPDSGSIKVDGVEVTTMDNSARDALMGKFGMLFQGGALFDSLPVWENVAFGLIHGKKMSKIDARPIAVEKIKAVGMGERVADLYPAELSGGMQKRISLARAIATNPDVIFFDEPTTGLDPIMADVINDLIVKCVKDLGATALTITHDMASARKIADKIAMIHEGKIIWSGTVKEMDKTTDPYVQQFIHGRADGPITKHANHAA